MMIRIALAAAMSLAAVHSASASAETDTEIAAAREAIWAKEMAIYAGRAEGSLDYYLRNVAPGFLAWTYGTTQPFGVDALAATGKKMAAQNKEKIETRISGFTLHGDTAVIYYINHRTVLPDGTAVDQTFDNIHVWVREDGDWKVLASMSRSESPPAP